jgi:predicted phosphate transport protein (TIGR00153 family)
VPGFGLVPQSQKFFDLFEEDAKNALAGAKLLREMLDDYDQAPRLVKKLESLEHEGDRITHDLFAELNKTFVTPLDREDIQALASGLDSVMDMMEAAGDTMVLYAVEQPTDQAKLLSDIIVDAVVQVEKSVALLRGRHNLREILVHCVEINRLENEADEVRRQVLGALFREEKDVIKLIKWREIYELLERTTDVCEDVADVLQTIVLKNG